MAAGRVPGMAAHMGLGATLPGTPQWFSCCPHAHILQEIQRVYCGSLKRCFGSWGCELGPGEPSQNELGQSYLSQGSSGPGGSHLSLLFAQWQSRALAEVGNRELLGQGVPKGQVSMLWLGVTNSFTSSWHCLPLSHSSFSVFIPCSIPVCPLPYPSPSLSQRHQISW